MNIRLLLEAPIRSRRAGQLAVKEIGCCCGGVCWWRPVRAGGLWLARRGRPWLRRRREQLKDSGGCRCIQSRDEMSGGRLACFWQRARGPRLAFSSGRAERGRSWRPACRGGWSGCKSLMTGRWGTQPKEGAGRLALVKGRAMLWKKENSWAGESWSSKGRRKLWFFQREGRPFWFQKVAAAGERVLGLRFSLFYPPLFFLIPPLCLRFFTVAWYL